MEIKPDILLLLKKTFFFHFCFISLTCHARTVVRTRIIQRVWLWKACVDPVCRRAEFRRPTWPWIWVCHISIIKYVVAGRSLCTIVPMLVFGASNRCTEKMLPTCRRWPEGVPAAHATSWLLEIRSRVFCSLSHFKAVYLFFFSSAFFLSKKKKTNHELVLSSEDSKLCGSWFSAVSTPAYIGP
jgi:hypothetical protein